MRGTPLMLQLLAWYFGPYYIFGASISNWRFPALILGFSLNYAAYFAEIYRGGIESIPKGQYEAAQVLGYSSVQTFNIIILPQVIKRIMPSITNEVITLVKDTSLATILAYSEIFSIAKQISASQVSFTPFVIAGVFYFIANYVVAFIMSRIEKALNYYK
jgi:ABC-type amino acid transport system permease subunit